MTTPTPKPKPSTLQLGRQAAPRLTGTGGAPPIFPVALMAIGGYLAWFGVRYFRTDIKWPTDPIKALLTGKPLPAATTTDAQAAAAAQALQPIAPVVAGTADALNATLGGNHQLAAAALKYVGASYVFGGNASRVGDWDCSSFVSYVLGHDLGLPLPGGKWGDPGMPPHAHGPVAAAYKLYGQAAPGPYEGVIVAWNTHVGIAIDNTRIVSARTTAEGVGISTISGTSQSIGETPTFRKVATK
jgi:cell wall-associated NlpC family hydrolase